MSSNDRNVRIFSVGDEVIYLDHHHIVLAGPVSDFHKNNHYWLKETGENDLPPVSACARNIYLDYE